MDITKLKALEAIAWQAVKDAEKVENERTNEWLAIRNQINDLQSEQRLTSERDAIRAEIRAEILAEMKSSH